MNKNSICWEFLTALGIFCLISEILKIHPFECHFLCYRILQISTFKMLMGT